MQLQRVAVVGTTCSGKTTFARRLAGLLGSPHIELDALHWEPKWTPAAPDVFRGRVAEAIASESWVTDGNYNGLLGRMNWRRAETLVWLDYPIWIIYPRLFRRTLGRTLKREELWNGNRESLRMGFLSRESLFVWALKTHWKHRRDWEAVLREPGFAHLRVVRLRRPRQTAAWLRAVEAAANLTRAPSAGTARSNIT
jgi:adenylate kinase family enzyme